MAKRKFRRSLGHRIRMRAFCRALAAAQGPELSGEEFAEAKKQFRRMDARSQQRLLDVWSEGALQSRRPPWDRRKAKA